MLMKLGPFSGLVVSKPPPPPVGLARSLGGAIGKFNNLQGPFWGSSSGACLPQGLGCAPARLNARPTLPRASLRRDRSMQSAAHSPKVAGGHGSATETHGIGFDGFAEVRGSLEVFHVSLGFGARLGAPGKAEFVRALPARPAASPCLWRLLQRFP